MNLKTEPNVLSLEKLMMISGGSTGGSWEHFGAGVHKIVSTVAYAEVIVARVHTRSHQQCFIGNKW
ncbi:hypothetical protein FGL74_04945 [Leuconostoc koreense]|nr:hypothetical protein FGL74_04945 [Leuconostoc mesenteroides]QGM24981.1 hypothetical protein GJV51_02920 [Leuconostoc mesenteroides subsp. mesenteroides]